MAIDVTTPPTVLDPSLRRDAIIPFHEIADPLSPAELSAKVASMPALQAALELDPSFRDSLFEMSHLAAETRAFQAVFSDAGEASIAAAANAEFSVLSDLLLSGRTPADAQAFYGHLMRFSILQDENGAPLIDPVSGKPFSDGTVGRFIQNTGALMLDHFAAQAETTTPDGGAGKDAALAEAIAVLRARAFPPRVGRSDEAIAAIEHARMEFDISVTKGIEAAVAPLVEGWFVRNQVAEEDRPAAAVALVEKAFALVAANPQFHREQDELMLRAAGPKTRDARIELGRRWVARVLPKVDPASIVTAASTSDARIEA